MARMILRRLRQRDRGERAAEVMPAALPHFDHHQHLAVAADEIELSRLAAHVARKHLETLGGQVSGRAMPRPPHLAADAIARDPIVCAIEPAACATGASASPAQSAVFAPKGRPAR